MTKILVVVATLLSTAAFGAPVLLASKVAYQPLLTKLKASGGDVARVVRVDSLEALTRLESGERYKFVLDGASTLTIAPLPAGAPNNEYVHPILARGGPVLTAGGVTVEHRNGKIITVVLDQDSKAYCPTRRSLDDAVHVLEKLGVASRLISCDDRPPQCLTQ